MALFLVLAPHFSQSPALLSHPQPSTPSYSAFSLANLFPTQTLPQQQERSLYPYSIIPRGVGSANELKLILANDSVAAAHYASFDLAKAHIIRVTKDRPVYVSYRLGNRVFWTKKKMVLHTGETLITDGHHAARTRCGNRVSETPMAPVTPEEPSAEKLNTPSFPGHSPIPIEPFDPAPLWASNPPSAPMSLPAPPVWPEPGGGIFFPPIVPILCCGGSGSPAPPPAPPPPAVRTPEPGTLPLLAVGFAALLFLRRK